MFCALSLFRTSCSYGILIKIDQDKKYFHTEVIHHYLSHRGVSPSNVGDTHHSIGYKQLGYTPTSKHDYCYQPYRILKMKLDSTLYMYKVSWLLEEYYQVTQNM